MPRTDEPCLTTGTHETDCAHEIQRRFTAGERLPACPRCEGPVHWLFVGPGPARDCPTGACCPERRVP